MLSKRYWFVILTYILMHLSGFVFVPLLYVQLNVDPYEALAYWNIIAFSIALIVILFILKEDMWANDLRGDAASLPQIVGWSFLGVFMAYGAQFLAVMIEMNVLGIDPGSENTEQIMEITRLAPAFIVIPAILAPILEEIVFRKVIFGSLYKRFNFFWAAIISSLIFGVIHLDLVHLLIYTAMGLVFAYLYVKTKRIIVPIIVHMGMNTITVIAQLLIDPEKLQQMQQELSFILIGG